MDAELVHRVFERVDAASANDDLQRSLREEFPGVHFTFCMDGDVQFGRVAREGSWANLYLVKKGEHCLSLTDDLDVATGFVVAELDE